MQTLPHSERKNGIENECDTTWKANTINYWHLLFDRSVMFNVISTLYWWHTRKKKHPNKKSLEGKSMCFLRFCCHSSDNFEVRNHISGVIFGLWLCIWALLFFLPMLFAPRTVIHLQSSIHSLPLYFMTERSEETPTSNQTIFIHINTAFGIDKPKTTAIISI